MRLHFIPIHVFRETPSVTFFDAGVPGSNGTDVVVHHGAATSPDHGAQSSTTCTVIRWTTTLFWKVLGPSRCSIRLGSPPPHHSFDLSDGCLQILSALITVPYPATALSSNKGRLVLNQSMRDHDLITERNSSPYGLKNEKTPSGKGIRSMNLELKDGHIVGANAQ